MSDIRKIQTGNNQYTLHARVSDRLAVSDQIGSPTKPVYVDNSGQVRACSRDIPTGMTIDSVLNDTSVNAVQNKVINAALKGKNPKAKADFIASSDLTALPISSGVLDLNGYTLTITKEYQVTDGFLIKNGTIAGTGEITSTGWLYINDCRLALSTKITLSAFVCADNLIGLFDMINGNASQLPIIKMNGWSIISNFSLIGIDGLATGISNGGAVTSNGLVFAINGSYVFFTDIQCYIRSSQYVYFFGKIFCQAFSSTVFQPITESENAQQFGFDALDSRSTINVYNCDVGESDTIVKGKFDTATQKFVKSQDGDVFILDDDTSSSNPYDFAIADEQGNAILLLKDGEINTKNFNSSDTSSVSGIPEAPMDGKTYGRNSGKWNVITSSGETYLGSIEYTGQQIVFPKMHYKQLGTLSNNQQCCIIHNNLAIFVNGTDYWVTDKNNNFKVLKRGNNNKTGLHSNVGSFGTEFYKGNKIPLLYLTDWDGTKGVEVFNLNSTTYAMTHLQSIVPSSELLNNDIFGRGNTDFIADKETGFLYSICYKEDTWREIETNKTCICKFALPRLSAGSTVTLKSSDIIDHFEVENIPTRQDCCIYNGILYIENGYINPHYKATLRAIDLSQKKVISRIDISKILDGEPECLEFDQDHLLMVYGKTIYGLYF